MNILKKATLTLALLLSVQSSVNADVLSPLELDTIKALAMVDTSTISLASVQNNLKIGVIKGEHSFSDQSLKFDLMAHAGQLIEITRVMEADMLDIPGTFKGLMDVFHVRKALYLQADTPENYAAGMQQLRTIAAHNYTLYRAAKV